jgi:hypothetical protein
MSVGAIHASTKAAACEMHKAHAPTVRILDVHHVTPLSWYAAAGRPPDPRTETLCPTGHTNVHAFIDLLVEHDGAVPWTVAVHYGKAERDLATLGYRRGLEAGLVPKRTL